MLEDVRNAVVSLQRKEENMIPNAGNQDLVFSEDEAPINYAQTPNNAAQSFQIS
jgi:hypothetical protein